MRTLDTVDFKGKKAVVRVDFNVPLNDNFEITDVHHTVLNDYTIQAQVSFWVIRLISGNTLGKGILRGGT